MKSLIEYLKTLIDKDNSNQTHSFLAIFAAVILAIGFLSIIILTIAVKKSFTTELGIITTALTGLAGTAFVSGKS